MRKAMIESNQAMNIWTNEELRTNYSNVWMFECLNQMGNKRMNQVNASNTSNESMRITTWTMRITIWKEDTNWAFILEWIKLNFLILLKSD